MDGAHSSQAFDMSRTLQELENEDWGDDDDGSYVVRASLELRRKSLSSLTDEDLRIGLEQQVGVGVLSLLAIERLGKTPLLEARLFQGDVLFSLLNLPAEFWTQNTVLRNATTALVAAARRDAGTMPDIWCETIWPDLQEAMARFSGRLPSKPWLRADFGRARPPAQRHLPSL